LDALFHKIFIHTNIKQALCSALNTQALKTKHKTALCCTEAAGS